MLVVTYYGALQLLRWALGIESVPTDALNVHLFTNNYTPTQSSEVGDFTEAAFSGYAPQSVDKTDWATPATVDGKATSTAPATPLVWTNGSGSVDVYGYFVTNADDDEVIYAQKFTSVKTVPNGEDLKLTLKLTDRTDPG